mmetsp:Transcript_68942/g.115084  ORF Transcript_68942/g.115084 Transcript_68942/m.115084 type:complete len:228 (-) Transcript_68942:2536-3219(-)
MDCRCTGDSASRKSFARPGCSVTPPSQAPGGTSGARLSRRALGIPKCAESCSLRRCVPPRPCSCVQKTSCSCCRASQNWRRPSQYSRDARHASGPVCAAAGLCLPRRRALRRPEERPEDGPEAFWHLPRDSAGTCALDLPLTAPGAETGARSLNSRSLSLSVVLDTLDAPSEPEAPVAAPSSTMCSTTSLEYTKYCPPMRTMTTSSASVSVPVSPSVPARRVGARGC